MKKHNLYYLSRVWAYFYFVALNFAFFFLMRTIFYFVNAPEGLVKIDVIKGLFVGARFDLRIAFLFALPLGIVFLLPKIPHWLKTLLNLIYAAAFSLVALVYFADFGYYAYLKERINAYIFELAANTATSLEMVWQSYPVVWGALALLIVGFIYYIILRKIIIYAYSKEAKKKAYIFAFIALLITAAFVHGRFSQYPLRWSNAYFSNNAFITSLALNPLQNLFDTYKFAKNGVTFDKEKTKQHYSTVADFLGVKKDAQNAETLNFSRPYSGTKNAKKYNVAVIITESLAYDKSSFASPEIDATPYLKKFSEKGTLFNRFFTPAAGTAKGVFASLTALPDLSTVKTSSRNPLLATQHVLYNDLDGYEKFYYIGGSASWANIRGLLEHNIEGLTIYEEGHYPGLPRNDVWGISDLAMFKYAVKEFKKLKDAGKPFFAILQTSGFHRPYTIPDDKGTFTLKEIDEKHLQDYSFSGNEEYNSMRFQDYAMGVFFDEMQKAGLDESNTIFVIYGDHGLTTQKSKTQPQSMIDFDLNLHHSPLVIVGPNVKKGVNKRLASQVDVSATVLGLLNLPRTETAVGRNLFNTQLKEGAFILKSSVAPFSIGVLEGDYYYAIRNGKPGLYKYMQDSTTDYCPQNPKKCEYLNDLTVGLFETARYMAFNNKLEK